MPPPDTHNWGRRVFPTLEAVPPLVPVQGRIGFDLGRPGAFQAPSPIGQGVLGLGRFAPRTCDSGRVLRQTPNPLLDCCAG